MPQTRRAWVTPLHPLATYWHAQLLLCSLFLPFLPISNLTAPLLAGPVAAGAGAVDGESACFVSPPPLPAVASPGTMHLPVSPHIHWSSFVQQDRTAGRLAMAFQHPISTKVRASLSAPIPDSVSLHCVCFVIRAGDGTVAGVPETQPAARDTPRDPLAGAAKIGWFARCLHEWIEVANQ